jgi:hypothetical protein
MFFVKSRDEEESQEETDTEKDFSSQETPSDQSTIIFEEYSGKLMLIYLVIAL